ncbi:hypothetical protein ACTXT7_001322 [Hymenolepis weldensis]
MKSRRHLDKNVIYFKANTDSHFEEHEMKGESAQGENVSEETLTNILSDLDLDRNGEVDQNEFFEFISSLKTGIVPHHSLKSVLNRPQIPVDRSGGGV